MKSMNVLGVVFDCKLNWGEQVSKSIATAKRAIFGLKHLRKFFNFVEMRQLLDSYVYSVLYYNSEIWLTPELNSSLKQSLLSTSAYALRSCLNVNDELSFVRLHEQCKKCTPKQIMLYKIALNVHKVLNDTAVSIKTETVRILEQTVFTRRQLTFKIYHNNQLRIGMNTNANKFYHINKLIGLEKLNYSYVHYKKIMKIQFLKFFFQFLKFGIT